MAGNHAAAISLALGAALSLGTAEALQLREAREIPVEQALRPGLLLQLVRRSRWLLGGLCDATGFLLLTLAMWQGSLVLVYPLITLALVWTLALLAAWYRTPLLPSEWAAVAAVIGGVALFASATGTSQQAAGRASALGWVTFGVIAGVVIAAVASAALGAEGRRRAILFALAGGLTDAVLAAVVNGLSARFDAGLVGVFTSWEVYAVIVVGIIDLLFKQTAYQAGYATITLPIMTVTDPLLTVLLGSVLFGEQAWASGAWLAPGLLGLAVMSAGLVRLGREPRLAVSRTG